MTNGPVNRQRLFEKEDRLPKPYRVEILAHSMVVLPAVRNVRGWSCPETTTNNSQFDRNLETRRPYLVLKSDHIAVSEHHSIMTRHSLATKFDRTRYRISKTCPTSRYWLRKRSRPRLNGEVEVANRCSGSDSGLNESIINEIGGHKACSKYTFMPMDSPAMTKTRTPSRSARGMSLFFSS